MARRWLVPLVISVAGLGLCSCEFIDVTVSGTNVTSRNTNNIIGCQPVGLEKTGKLDPTGIRVLNNTGPVDAWIGAQVQLSPWINITGCFLHDNSVSRISDDGVDISNVRSPVKACFDQCSSNEFAITSTRCYCLHNGTHLNGIPCLGHACGSRNDSLCGHNNTCMCHYKQLRTYPTKKGTGNCMTIRKVNNTYIYNPQYCSYAHTVLCTFTNQSGIAVYGDRTMGAWSNALSNCDHNHQWLLGLSAENIPKHSHNLDENFSYWIGMFRTQHFHWGDSYVNSGQCVSIHIMSNTETTLELRLRNCGTNLPVLCEHTEAPSASHNPTDISTPSSSSSSTSSPPPSSSSPPSQMTTGVPLPPIVGSAAGVVVIVLIVSVGCLMKRRKRQTKHQKSTRSHSEANMAIDADSSRYVDIDDHHNTTYSELSKNYEDPIEAEDDYTYNHLHSVGSENKREDNLYHHTNDFRSEYDSLENFNHCKDDQTESEYDHIKASFTLHSSTDTGNYDTMKKPNKGQDASIDDTYDHM